MIYEPDFEQLPYNCSDYLKKIPEQVEINKETAKNKVLIKALTTVKNIETGFFQPHNRANCIVCKTGIPCKNCIDEEYIKLGRFDIKKDEVLYVRYQHKNTVSLTDENGFIYSVNRSDFHSFFENLKDRS